MQEISKTINWLTGGAYGGRGRGWGGSHREIFARVRVRGPRTASCPLLVRPRPFQRRDLPERLIHVDPRPPARGLCGFSERFKRKEQIQLVPSVARAGTSTSTRPSDSCCRSWGLVTLAALLVAYWCVVGTCCPYPVCVGCGF